MDTPAVEQLKRTCVRLCGIAAFEQKDAQDAVRESGALVSILSMCQINDANPSKSRAEERGQKIMVGWY